MRKYRYGEDEVDYWARKTKMYSTLAIVFACLAFASSVLTAILSL